MSVFLSYKREDVEIVEKVYEILKTRGYSVFIDREINSGEDFREKLISQLHESNCVITFWSENSIKSRWVIDEAEYALGKGILVPVLLDDTSPPFGFGDINAANLFNWDGDEEYPELKKILKAIDWVSDNKMDSVKEIEKGINKILDPLPRKDYREFKSSQNDLNESIAGILKEVLELNQKATESLIKKTSRADRIIKVFQFVVISIILLYVFHVLNIIESALTNMSSNLDSMQASIGNMSDKTNTMAEDTHIMQGSLTNIAQDIHVYSQNNKRQPPKGYQRRY